MNNTTSDNKAYISSTEILDTLYSNISDAKSVTEMFVKNMEELKVLVTLEDNEENKIEFIKEAQQLYNEFKEQMVELNIFVSIDNIEILAYMKLEFEDLLSILQIEDSVITNQEEADMHHASRYQSEEELVISKTNDLDAIKSEEEIMNNDKIVDLEETMKIFNLKIRIQGKEIDGLEEKHINLEKKLDEIMEKAQKQFEENKETKTEPPKQESKVLRNTVIGTAVVAIGLTAFKLIRG